MRTFIIGLSIVLFMLSGGIVLKALGIGNGMPETVPAVEAVRPAEITPEIKEMLGHFVSEQKVNRQLVAGLQSTIDQLENQLKDLREKPEADSGRSGDAGLRIVAVLGGDAFKSGRTTINNDFLKVIEGIAADIKSDGAERIVIAGHTDSATLKKPATKRYKDNMALSFLRAETVAQIISGYDIPLDRIEVVGYGAMRPLATNRTTAGRAKNRRVEIAVAGRRL
ncbi:MAG: OmpA family protein [Nitrospira sp.]|nr:OmpA family protein [bacterium]MBL7050136.1 OmpA family protein [Nitrospira sp.]